MRTVFKYLSPYRWRLAAQMTIKVLATLVELLIPVILTHILRDVIKEEEVRPIVLWGGVMLVCAVLACLMNIIANRMAAGIACDFSLVLRRDLFRKTLSLSSAQIDRFTVPSLESRITTDTYHVHTFVITMQRMGTRAPILLLGGTVITFIMDAHLALVMLATLPIAFLLVYFLTVKGIPLYAKVQRSVDGMVRVVREDAQGVRVIKALSKNEYENRRYDAANRALIKDETHVGTVMGSVRPLMSLLMNVGVTVVVALSALRVSGHLSDTETVIAFLQYFTQITMAMLAISRVLLIVTKCIASAARITEVLKTEEELLPEPCPVPPTAYDPNAFISFKDVSFSYTGAHKHVSDLSFSLKEGGSLGIIGATGSGKSTIIRLLLRAYDVTEGEVCIAGKNVKCYDKGELTSLFGVALQKDFLYADTVEENILFGRSLSHEEVERATQIACAHEFITAFPEGYGRMLSTGGTNLSGGQRQRVLLARALCGKPKILVLDDASSALDYKTDARFRENLAKEMAGVTTITVAQRISSIKHCDLILVLDEGKIIGRGTHEELLRDSAVYREISETQMGGAFVE